MEKSADGARSALTVGLEGERKEVKQTHGAQVEWRGEDGFKRTVVVAKFNDGRFKIKFETWWDGDEKQPLTTAIALTTEAFESAVSLFIGFSMNMSEFKVEPSNVQAKGRCAVLSRSVPLERQVGHDS